MEDTVTILIPSIALMNMKITKVYKELQSLVGNTSDRYLDNDKEQYCGHRTKSLLNRNREYLIVTAIRELPNLSVKEVAEHMYINALELDYYYRFEKEYF